MFMVYWTEVQQDGSWEPNAKYFDTDLLAPVMPFMEELRKRQRADGTVRHVSMSSENVNSVGMPGVDVPKPDYNWTKRRPNERPRK